MAKATHLAGEWAYDTFPLSLRAASRANEYQTLSSGVHVRDFSVDVSSGFLKSEEYALATSVWTDGTHTYQVSSFRKVLPSVSLYGTWTRGSGQSVGSRKTSKNSSAGGVRRANSGASKASLGSKKHDEVQVSVEGP